MQDITFSRVERVDRVELLHVSACPVWIAIGLAFLALGAVAGSTQRVKVIAHGWDVLSVTPTVVLQNAESLDRLPIDGLILNVCATNHDGVVLSHKTLAYDPDWRFELFADLPLVFRKIVSHRSLRHSFAGAWIGNTWRKNDVAHRKRWTDDAAWARFANNLGVLARIVREGGLEGIVLDNEDYSHLKQFFWQEGDGDFDETRELARKRGREVFGAAFREKPDLKVMAFWFLSWPFGNYLRSDDPDASRRAIGDLWPDFVNGMLDVMPDGARFIDGDETSYYSRADRNDFFLKAVALRKNVMPLVAHENRVGYRGKLLFAPASYLDSYTNGSSSPYYMPPTADGTRVDRFYENFIQAVEASDGYTWIYGERHPLIAWRGVSLKRCADQTWDEVLPGLYDVIGCGRDAGEHGRTRFGQWELKKCVPSNRIESGSCRLRAQAAGTGFATNRLAKGFSFWKHGQTFGEIGTDTACGHGDSFSVRLEKVERGCVLFILDGVKAGERYVVRAFGKGEHVKGGVDFVDTPPRYRMSFGEPGTDGWRAGYAYIVVPHGQTRLRIMLNGSKDEVLWYDDIGIYPDLSSGATCGAQPVLLQYVPSNRGEAI